MTQQSYWSKNRPIPDFPQLNKNITVDVAVIGGGITGVTAAYMMRKAGLSVALLERDRFGSVDTGHTTAHLTYVTDLRLHELVANFGANHAQAVWDAGRAAIQQIDENIKELEIDCDFSWVPGYLHAAESSNEEKESRTLKHDAELAIELGFDATYMHSVPFMGTEGVRFNNQAKFHPLKYLAGMLAGLDAIGGYIFQGAEVTEITDNPLTVVTRNASVNCHFVFVATHVPLMGKASLVSATVLQTKLAAYSSYVVGAKVPSGSIPVALYWDTGDPYNYLRVDQHADFDYVIFGGADHKTGQAQDTDCCFTALEKSFADYVAGVEIDSRWTGQVIETNDGLPLIGEISPHQFAATGFAGNGMTFGTLGAMMACDAVMKRKNPWADLFEIHRTKLKGGTWDYIKENIDYPYYIIRDRFTGASSDSPESLKPGEGKVLKINGQKVAAYRDHSANLVTVSPICSHMGCVVHWNSSDATWDCPCHGSRFQPTGEVVTGPAETPLKKIEIDENAAAATSK